MILSFGFPRMPYNAKNPQDFDYLDFNFFRKNIFQNLWSL